MQTLLLIIHISVSFLLILVVLLQSGRGGGMGATFGGASQQIFGGRGAGSFLTRVTTFCAVVFFFTSLTLSMVSSHDRSVMESELDAKEKATQAGEKDASEPEAGETGTEATDTSGMAEPPAEEVPAEADSATAAPAEKAAPGESPEAPAP